LRQLAGEQFLTFLALGPPFIAQVPIGHVPAVIEVEYLLWALASCRQAKNDKAITLPIAINLHMIPLLIAEKLRIAPQRIKPRN
jgi:hypothetical protein